MKHITHALINKYKTNILNLSHITEAEIRDIWHNPGEEYLTDFTSLIYDFDIPLYQKMIFRFRNGSNLAVILYQGCDPSNKRRILYTYNMFYEEVSDLMEFFAWIANGLGIHHINIIAQNDGDDFDYVTKWKENNIEFFFSLTDSEQNKLINQFNKECVDAYNDFNAYDDV